MTHNKKRHKKVRNDPYIWQQWRKAILEDKDMLRMRDPRLATRYLYRVTYEEEDTYHMLRMRDPVSRQGTSINAYIYKYVLVQGDVGGCSDYIYEYVLAPSSSYDMYPPPHMYWDKAMLKDNDNRQTGIYTDTYTSHTHTHTHTHTQQVAALLAEPDQGGSRRRQQSKTCARCSNTPSVGHRRRHKF